MYKKLKDGVHIEHYSPIYQQGINRLRAQPDVARNMLFLPTENRQDLDYPNVFCFVLLTTADYVIGYAALRVSTEPRLRHIGSIEVAVDQSYRGNDYGKELVELTLRQGFMWLNLHRIELICLCDNKTALSLYGKMGFKTEGVYRDGIIRDGEYRDEFIMSILKQEYDEGRIICKNQSSETQKASTESKADRTESQP
jgi:putative acetyltransferase